MQQTENFLGYRPSGENDTGEGGGIPGVLSGWFNNVAGAPTAVPKVTTQAPAPTPAEIAGDPRIGNAEGGTDNPSAAPDMANAPDPSTGYGKAVGTASNAVGGAISGALDAKGVSATTGALGSMGVGKGLAGLGLGPMGATLGLAALGYTAYNAIKEGLFGPPSVDTNAAGLTEGGLGFTGGGAMSVGGDDPTAGEAEAAANADTTNANAQADTQANTEANSEAAAAAAAAEGMAADSHEASNPGADASSGGPDAGGDPSGHDGSDGSSGGQGFADGGMIGQPGLAPTQGGAFIDPAMGGGAPGQMAAQGPGLAAQGQPAGPLNPKMFQSRMINMLQSDPARAQGMQAAVQKAIATGQVTEQQIMQLSQIAQTCLHTPALYPKLVALAVQEGIVPAGKLPPTYNERTVAALAAVGHFVGQNQQQGDMGGEGQPGQLPQGQAPQQALAKGGIIRGPGTGRSDSISAKNTSTGGTVNVSNGEYVIPAHVVQVKGKEFFDNLLRKYAQVSGERKEA